MRRPKLIAALATIALIGTGYAAGAAAATDTGAQAFQLRWSPNPGTDGLDAFVGIEDDRSHSHPGVKHLLAEAHQYRVLQHQRDRDGPDRQRNEGRANRKGSQRIDKDKGQTRRYPYPMYIPRSLKGATYLTHLFPVKQ